MGSETLGLVEKRKEANFRLANVSGFKTDLIEIHSHNPALHVVFIPGNPGVISFYTDFLESLYELLGGNASVTAIGQISHSEKNWESGRLFSLQEQTNHKISFIEQELKDVDAPIILVGHSVGAHISLEVLKRSQKADMYCICLYPYLVVDTACSVQSFIRRISESVVLSSVISTMGALLGRLPPQISRFLVQRSIGKSWSSPAIQVLCSHVLQYHMIRNMLYMAMTVFHELPEKPEWEFIQGKKTQISFLFGEDDRWGPLHVYDELCKQVPGVRAEVEREGHTHSFSCSEAGSLWVARHISNFIKSNRKLEKLVT